MKYAVVTAGGRQFRVSEGDVVTLDRLSVKPDDSYTFAQVLLVVDGDTRHVGSPIVDGIQVSAKVLEHTKGEKIRVGKFKAKAKYRRVTGFRASLTKVQIESIGQSKSEKATK